MLADLHHVLRSLWKDRAFSLAAIVTLALGVGLNAAVASAVHGVLLLPLSFPRSERLYVVWQDMERRGGTREDYAGMAVFSDWRARNRSFSGMAAFARQALDISSLDPPESVTGAWVSHEYFSVLGVRPLLGRFFAPDEEIKGRNSVVVLSHELWVRRFGSDPAVVGRTIRASFGSYTVVGILSQAFHAPLMPDAELYWPMPLTPLIDDRPYSTTGVIGRLADGVSPAAAAADMRRVAAAMAADHSQALHDVGATLAPARDAVAGQARKPLLALFGAVLLVLLIAGVNVGNLALSRAAGRRAELAMRLALGARPRRIARLLVAECLVLATAAAALGLALGGAYLGLLRGLAPPQTPRLDAIRLDGAVVAATFALALGAGLLAGLLPALWSLRRPFGLLREAAGASAGRGGLRARGVLIVAQVAASALLLVGAASLLRTLAALARVDPGFRTEGVVVGRLNVQPAHPPALGDVAAFMQALEAGLRQRPEIAAVGEIVPQPLADRQFEMTFTLEGQAAAAAERQGAVWRWASPGYFQAFGIPAVEGRAFRDGDDAAAPLVAVVNERFAARYLGGRSAVGRRLRSVMHDGPDAPWRRIVGVIRDLRGKLDEPPAPEIVLPLYQDQGPLATVVARAAGQPAAALRAMQEVATRLRPGQVVARRETLAAALDRGLAPRRFAAGLVGSFAAVALALAAVGIYGVTALAVSRRRRELAVRLALGARPGAILGLLLRWLGALFAAGIALGLGGVVAAGRAVAGLLYGVRPTDAATVGGVVALLALVALAAALRPAWGAARMAPSAVLKSER